MRRKNLLRQLTTVAEEKNRDDVQFIVEDLLQWLCTPSAQPYCLEKLGRTLAELADGDVRRLAAIHQAVTNAVAADSHRRLADLLLETTREFIHAGSTSVDAQRKRGIHFLQKIIDTVGDPIFVKDEDHRWIFLNEAYCQFIGRPMNELLGRSDYDFFPKAEADIFWEKDNLVFDTGKPDENEETFTDTDGQEHIIITKKTMFVDAGGDKFLVGVIRDVSERRRLESRLSMAKRLMSLGTLAGGVAHEINNPLSYVLANLQYIQDAVDDPAESRESIIDALNATVNGAERVRKIVQSLKTFSHAENDTLLPTDLRGSLRATVELAKNEIRHRARLTEEYGDIPFVEANEGRLGQIFLNLLVNATQALTTGHAAENEIHVETRTGDAGDVIVEISDTGQGISDENLDHIFDPFFTTKPVGQGTGLGLSICHSLVESMGGHIEVESELGQGSTFRVIFPATEREPVESDEEKLPTPTAPSDPKDRPRILVIDDEPEILASLNRRLKNHFDVVFIDHADEALALLLADAKFDFILCDVMMPDMNGREFLEALIEHAPHYVERLAFFSGGVFDPDLQDFLADQDQPVLDKLIDVATLHRLIDDV